MVQTFRFVALLALSGAATAALAPVSGLSCSGGDYSVSAEWIAAAGATQYQLNGAAFTTATDAVFPGLPNDAPFEIRVAASNGSHLSQEEAVTCTPSAPVSLLPVALALQRTWAESAAAPAWGDIDADGDQDLVVGYADGGVLHLRSEDGELREASDGPFPDLAGLSARPTLADTTADGLPDAVVGLRNGSLLYYVNTGGAFERAAWLTDAVQLGPNSDPSPLLFDLYGDSHPDVIVGLRNGSAEVLLLNNTDGVSPLHTSVLLALPEGLNSSAPFVDFGSGSLCHGTASGEIYCPDVPPGAFSDAAQLAYVAPACTPAELCALGALDSALVYYGVGSDSVVARVVGARNTRLALVDLSGDGVRDLLALSDGSRLEYFVNNATDDDLAPQYAQELSLPAAAQQLVDLDGLDLAVGDMDLDGSDDLVWVGAAGDVRFGEAATLLLLLPTGTVGLDAADMDSDGDQDLVADGVVYENPGDAVFVLDRTLATVSPVERLRAIDLDHDGDLDLLGPAWSFENVGDAETPIFAEAEASTTAASGQVVVPGLLGFAAGILQGDVDEFRALVAHPDEPASAPTLVAGPSYIDVSWEASPDDNGAPVTGYAVNGQFVRQTSARLYGLAPGVEYGVNVTAINDGGESRGSATAFATPLATPSAPGNVTCEPMDGAIFVSWELPAYNSDGVVTYSLGEGGTNATVSGLANDRPHTVTVWAVNAFGTSAEAGACSATPRLDSSVLPADASDAWGSVPRTWGETYLQPVLALIKAPAAGPDYVDLAVATATKGVLSFFNAGTLTAPVLEELLGDDNPFADVAAGEHLGLAVGDLDGDGAADFLVGYEDGRLKIDGVEDIGIDVGAWAKPSLADLDDDGDLDLAVGALDGSLWFFNNTGNSTLPRFNYTGLDHASTASGAAAPFLVDDFTGDNFVDLCVGEADGTIECFAGTGYGAAFGASATTTFAAAGTHSTLSCFQALGGPPPTMRCAVGHASGMQIFDLDVGSTTERDLESFLWGTTLLREFNQTDPIPAVLDVDDDGDLDWVVGHSGAGLSLFRRETDVLAEVLDGSNETPLLSGVTRVCPTAAALFGLDTPGLVIGEPASATLTFYSWDGGSGSFEEAAPNPFDALAGSFADVRTAVADLNGDDVLDLWVGGNAWVANTGSLLEPEFLLSSVRYVDDAPALGGPALCDLDRDGDLDVSVGLGAGHGFLTIENMGDGTFFQRQRWVEPWATSGSAGSIQPLCLASGGIVAFDRDSLGFFSVAARPSAPPGLVTATDDGGGEVTVVWNAAADNGLAVERYEVRNNATGSTTTTTTTTTTSATITGFSPGDRVVFNVTATNSAGTSEAASTLLSLVVSDAPSAPTALACASGDDEATISWAEPDFNAASVTEYTIEVEDLLGVATLSTTELSIPITSLANGLEYEVTVFATGSEHAASCSVAPQVPLANVSAVDVFTSNVLAPLLVPSVGDVDLDGIDDLMLGSNSGFYYLNGNGTAFHSRPTIVDDGGDSAPRLALGDVDGDGDDDIVTALFFNGTLRLHPGGNLLSYTTLLATGFRISGLALGDLDQDGDVDLLVGRAAAGDVYHYDNIGSEPYFSLVGAALDGTVFGSSPTPALCDVDADGFLDALVGSALGTVAYARGSQGGVDWEMAPLVDVWAGVDVGDFSAPACESAQRRVVVGSATSNDLSFFEMHTGKPNTPPGFITLSSYPPFNITWAQPADHGDTITNYVLSDTVLGLASNTDNAQNYGVFDDIPSGQTLALTAVAENSLGSSAPSTESTISVLAPVAVSALECTPGDYSINVTWEPPDPWYGIEVLYTVTMDSSGEETLTYSDAQSPLQLTGLDNGVSYSFTVTPSNFVGAGPSTACAATPFAPPVLFAAASTGALPTLPSGSTFAAPRLVDMDADGDLDLMVGTLVSGVLVYENVGDDAFELNRTITSVSQSRLIPAGGANGTDVVVGTGEGLLFRDTAGVALAGVEDGQVAPAVGDLNGDGELDLVVGGLLVFLSFDSELAAVHNLDPDPTCAPDLGDYDDDGDLDLVLACAASGVRLFENQDGEFIQVLEVPHAASDGPVATLARGLFGVDVGVLVGDSDGSLSWYTLAGHPDKPVGAVVADVADDGSTITLAWEAGADNGAEITEYTVTALPSGNSYTTSATSLVVSDLEYSADLEFYVSASNAAPAASVDASGALGSIAVTGTPDASQSVTVTWEADAFFLALTNASSAVVVTSDDTGDVVTGTLNDTSSVTFTGLTSCDGHHFSVEIFTTSAEDSASVVGTTTERVVPWDACPECCAALADGSESGLYTIDPSRSDPFEAYCDMDTDGGEWTVIAAVSGAAFGQQALVAGAYDRPGGDPFAFEEYSLTADRKAALLALSTESLVVRGDGRGAALRVEAALMEEGSRGCTVTELGSGASAEATCSANLTSTTTTGADLAVGEYLYSSAPGDPVGDAAYVATDTLGLWFGNATDPLPLYVAMRLTYANVSIEQRPPDATNLVVDLLTDFDFAVAPSSATVELSIDDADWVPWDEATFNELHDQTHELHARAVVSWWGVSDHVEYASWRYDTRVPSAVFGLKPIAFTGETSSTFGVTSFEAPVVFEYDVDNTFFGTQTSDEPSETKPDTFLQSEADRIVTALPVLFNTSSDTEDTGLEYMVDEQDWLGSASSSVAELELEDGWHAVLLRAVSADGTPDLTAAAATVRVFVDSRETREPDTSIESRPDAVSDDNEPVFGVACDEEDGTCYFQFRLDGNETWTNSSSADLSFGVLPEGQHRLLVRAVDAAGNVDPTPAAWYWTQVLPTAPDTLLLNGTDAVSSATTAEFSLTCDAPPCVFEYSVDLGGVWEPVSNGSAVDVANVSLSGLELGFHSLAVRTVGVRGLVDETPVLVSWQVVDPPTAELVLQPLDASYTLVTIFAIEMAGGSQCTFDYSVTAELDGAVWQEGTADADHGLVVGPLDYGNFVFEAEPQCELPASSGAISYAWEVTPDYTDNEFTVTVSEGRHYARVRATDEAGNVSPYTIYNWTVDGTVPDTYIEFANGIEVITTPNLNLSIGCIDDFSCGVSLFVDDGEDIAFDKLPSGWYVLDDVADGDHNLTVQAVDAAGNRDPTPITTTFSVDATAPEVNVSSVYGAVVRDPLFVVSCRDACGCSSIQWAVDNGTLTAADGRVNLTSAGYGDGEYELFVAARDCVGNERVVSLPFQVDLVAPVTRVGQVADIVTTPNVSVPMGCDDASACVLNYTLDGHGVVSVPAGVVNLTLLSSEAHELVVVAVDEAGNVGDELVVRFEVDTVPPVVRVDNVTALPGGSVALDLGCSEADCAFATASVEGDGTNVTWTTPTAVLVANDLGQDGEYEVCFAATDPAGNAALDDACVDVVVDSVAPQVTLATDTLPEFSLAAVVNVSFAVDDANAVSCECASSPGSVALCTTQLASVVVGPSVSVANLTLEVTCTDVGANSVSVAAGWVVDRVPPVVDLALVSGALTSSTSSLALFSCDDLSPCLFNVSVDGVLDAALVADDRYNVRDLDDATHVITVTAVDVAGNAALAPASAEVTVDTAPPQVFIAATNGLLTSDPRFWVNCSDPVGCVNVTYSLEADEDVPLALETELGGFAELLSEGSHVFSVRAYDSAGNREAASQSFVLDTVSPTTDVLQALPEYSNSPNVSVAIGCSDVSDCWLRFNASTPVVSESEAGTLSLTGLADGAHVVEVYAVDAATNRDDTPVVWALTVDTVAPVASVVNVSYAESGSSAVVEFEVEGEDTLAVDSDATPASLAVSWSDDRRSATVFAADGAYELFVVPSDPAGNEGEAVQVPLVLDTVFPVIELVEAPPAATNLQNVSIVFDVADVNPAGCSCRTADGALACAAGAPTEVSVPSAFAAAWLEVACADVRGHWAAVNASWTVDRVLPEVSSNWSVVTTNAPQWRVFHERQDGTATTVDCAVTTPAGYVVPTSNCESPWVIDVLTEGDYELTVTVADLAGNAANLSLSTTYDTTPPSPVFDSTVAEGLTAAFTFRCVKTDDDCGGLELTDDDCSFDFVLDGGARQPADGTSQLIDELPDARATHEFEVIATDAAGNEASVSYIWSTSSTLQPVLDKSPVAVTGTDFSEFQFSVELENAEFEYRLDASATFVTTGVVMLPSEGNWTRGAYNVSTPDPGWSFFQPYDFFVRVVGYSNSAAFGWSRGQCAQKGEITLVLEDGSLQCDPCPDQGVDCANGVAEPIDGFWRSSASTYITKDSVFYQCPIAESCLGGAECLEGYTGVMCSLCDEGFSMTLGRCRACSDATVSYVLLASGVLTLVTVLAVVLKKSKTIVQGSAFKVVLNFVHMASAIIAFDIEWPGKAVNVVAFLAVVNVQLTEITTAGCSGVPITFYTKWLAAIILPTLIVIGIWARQRALKRPKSTAVRNTVLVLLFLYPGVSGTLIQFFNCREVEGLWYLQADYSQQCFTSTWYSWLVVALVLTPAFVVGVPGYMLYLLYNARDRLNEEEETLALGLLHRSYRDSQYHHEVIVLVYKMSLWLAAVLLAEGVILQSTVGLFLSAVMLVVHATQWPYTDREKNVLQLLNYATAVTMCIGGLVLKLTDTAPNETETESVLGLIDTVVITQVCVLIVAAVVANVIGRRRRKARALAKKAAEASGSVEMVSSSSSSSSASASATASPTPDLASSPRRRSPDRSDPSERGQARRKMKRERSQRRKRGPAPPGSAPLSPDLAASLGVAPAPAAPGVGAVPLSPELAASLGVAPAPAGSAPAASAPAPAGPGVGAVPLSPELAASLGLAPPTSPSMSAAAASSVSGVRRPGLLGSVDVAAAVADVPRPSPMARGRSARNLKGRQPMRDAPPSPAPSAAPRGWVPPKTMTSI